MNLTPRIALLGLAMSLASATWAAPIGYTISDVTKNLYSIDLATGVATNLGQIPFADGDELEGLAAIGSTLYGVSEANNGEGTLWDVTTPPGSQVGTNTRQGTEAGAAYSSFTGLLYNIQGDELSTTGVLSWLYTISPTDATATLLGTSGTYADGLAINPLTGEAFASDFRLSDSLYSVNLNDGSLTLVGGFGIGDTALDSGLAFDVDGTLYALTENGAIYTVNTGTGEATFQANVTLNGGTIPGDLEGLEILPGDTTPIPEPGSMMLLGAGLAGLVAVARRHSR